MKHVLAIAALIAAAIISSPGDAQTANGSPTAPAPGGGAGMPPSTSTIGPSGGQPNGAAQTPQTGGETPVEQKEQRKSDQDMSICKGC